MTEDDIYKLDIETDDRDVDRTAKKLRSLDKLLQQTQRRVALLGKTRIKPILALDDRLMSAAQKAKGTLERLHRTKAKPTVLLSDHASNSALKLRASLVSLAAGPWRVSIVGVDWEEVIGDSFSRWISSDGKSTLKRISSAVGEMLGEGLKVKIMEALGLRATPEMLLGKRDSGKENINTSSSDVNSLYSVKEMISQMARMWGTKKQVKPGFEDGRYYSVSEFLDDIANGKISNGSFNRSDRNTSIGLLESYPQELNDHILKDLAKDKLNQIVDLGGSSTYESWQNKWPDIKSQMEPIVGSKTIDKMASIGQASLKGWRWAYPYIDKVGGVAGIALDTLEIATAKPGKDRYGKIYSVIFDGIFSSIGGAIGMAAGPAGAFVGSSLFGTLGEMAGEDFGRFKYDVDTGKIILPPRAYSDRIMAPSVQGVTRPESNVNVPKVMGTPVPNYYQLPEEVRSKIGEASYKNPTPPVNVSLSEGTINLTVNKEKLDYQKLAETTGWKIANEVRFAMQNLK